MSWVQTYTGRRVDLFDPKPEQIDIEDIAHALSMQCRFGGHTREFYSVAQHSVIVAMAVPVQLAFVGLMHDATEAYIGDMVRPLKQELPGFKVAEDAIWGAVCQRWPDLPIALPREVKLADMRALATEARDMLPGGPRDWESIIGVEPFPLVIQPQSQADAKRMFLHAFNSLSGDACAAEVDARVVAARVIGRAVREGQC